MVSFEIGPSGLSRIHARVLNMRPAYRRPHVEPPSNVVRLAALPSIVVGQIRQRCVPLVVLTLALVALMQTRLYIPSFVDESDNFLGGFLISHGAVLYRDYFSHHMPLPYLIAACTSWLGASSIDDQRTFTALAVFAVYSFVLLRFRLLLGGTFLALTIVSLAASHMVFWGNMLLAETILSSAILILFLYFYASPPFIYSVGDQVIISVVVCAAAMSTLVSAYPLLALVAVYVLRRLTDMRHGVRILLRRELFFLGILSLPFAVAAVLLAMSGAWSDFVDQAVTFNRVYYSQFDLSSDPLGILATALRSDYHYVRDNLTATSLLTGQGLMILAGGVASLLVARQRGILLGVLLSSLLVLSRLREEPFHDQSFYMLSIVAVAVVATWAVDRFRAASLSLWRQLAGGKRALNADTLRSVLRLMAPALALTGAMVFYVGIGAAYAAAPLFIQPSGYVFEFSAAIDAITEPTERIWVGPIDPQAYLAARRLPASRYAFYLPWLAASPQISAGLVSDLEASQPPVVVINFGAPIIRWTGVATERYVVSEYAAGLAAYLNQHYTPVDINNPRWSAVYLRRDRSAELLQRLETAGFYAPASTQRSAIGSLEGP